MFATSGGVKKKDSEQWDGKDTAGKNKTAWEKAGEDEERRWKEKELAGLPGLDPDPGC